MEHDGLRAVLDALDSAYPAPLRYRRWALRRLPCPLARQRPGSFAATYRMLVDLELASDLARLPARCC
jgi:hypothetical protein